MAWLHRQYRSLSVESSILLRLTDEYEDEKPELTPLHPNQHPKIFYDVADVNGWR